MAPIHIYYLWPQRKKELLCNYLAIITGVVCVYPVTKVSLRQMLLGQSVKKVTSYTVHEGFFLLYRGVVPQIIQRCSSITGTYIVHQNIEKTYEHYSNTMIRLHSGFFLGTLDSLLMPLERVQVLLAAKRYNHVYKNTWYCFHSLFSQHGFKELYRGFEVVYFRNVFASIIFISLLLKKEEILNQQDNDDQRTAVMSASRVALDSLHGTLVSTIVHPINVLRVFLHGEVGHRHVHIHKAFRQIYRVKGVHFFFNGMFTNMFRSWTQWVLIAFSNEMYKKFYTNYISSIMKK